MQGGWRRRSTDKGAVAAGGKASQERSPRQGEMGGGDSLKKLILKMASTPEEEITAQITNRLTVLSQDR